MTALFKKNVIMIFCVACLTGCSVVNFSANYYTPPENYPEEIVALWTQLQSQIKLKYQYDIRIVDGQDSDRVNGVPFVSNKIIYFPRDFIKYVYQNYYNDRGKIFTSVIVHEICHPEYNLPSAPVNEHFKTDVAAIKLLGNDRETAEIFYKSFFVMKNYWFARKGLAGHTLNVGVNVLSGASMAFGGPGVFVNLFATDLTQRMNMIAQEYKLTSRGCFNRSSEKQ